MRTKELAVIVAAAAGVLGGGCGGPARTATASTSPPQAERRAVRPACDDETLRAFDPGLPGHVRVALERVAAPDSPHGHQWQLGLRWTFATTGELQAGMKRFGSAITRARLELVRGDLDGGTFRAVVACP